MSDTSSQSSLTDEQNKDQEDAQENMGNVKSKLKKFAKQEKETNDAEEMEVAVNEHPFMCGVVEGFYGRPWTAEQRKELFRRMEEMGLNAYLYGPKDDYKHRLFWREKYSPDETELLKTLIDEATAHNVVFVYAISPGLDMVFASQKEITALKEKLLQVKELGCKAFALLFDDIDPILCASDMDEFDSSADAQASITNLMFNALDKPRFLFCPTEYCSTMAVPDVATSPYLKTLGTSLHPQISVMWTGAKVVSHVITVESIKELNKILRRQVMIWDNIHANDYDPKRVFFGPYKGRSTHLIPHLSGVLTNPNCEFESNFVAMHTVATWWKNHKEKVNEKGECTSSNATKEEKQEEASEQKKPEKATSPSSQPLDDDSASSGRASDTDSDTDSDYSSHDGGYFPSMANFQHGDYDPYDALEKALQDWLPVFSWIRYPSRKVIPRSGTPAVLPQISHPSLTTRPPLPDISVTASVKEPIVSVGESVKSSENKAEKRKSDVNITTDSVKITVNDNDSSKSDIDIEVSDGSETPQTETTRCAITSLSDQDNFQKGSSSDVDMTASSSKESIDVVAAADSGPPSPREKGNDKIQKKEESSVSSREMGDNKAQLNADVEMKEEIQGNTPEEKILEEMQTSPKNPTLADQMETEEIQEPSTPMMTDEIDSDVSMATAQSGSAVPADLDEMAAPSPGTAEMKEAESNKSPPLETFCKLEEVKVVGSSKVDMATPKVKAIKTSILQKYEEDPLSLEDLRLLAECFFLPYEHGQVGKSMVQKFKWLRENAIKLSAMKDKKSETFIDKALNWSERALAFEENCRDLLNVFNKICSCPNRALLYDIFPYLWDMKGVVTMLRSYVKWLGRVEVRPDSSDKPDVGSCVRDPSKLAGAVSSPGFSWLGGDPEPWVFRGGLSGEFQRLLPVSSAFDLFCQTLPLDPEVCTFIVRPYVPADEKSVFDVCYATYNDGMGSSDAFLNHKDLPADRLVGGFLTLSPEYCFVVEDDDGLCGYLVATLDAKKFWKRYEVAYLPEMREKYEMPAESDAEMTEAEKMIVDIHDTGDRFDYGNDELPATHPSYLTMALHPRANSNIAKSMLVCLLSALKLHHSCGVHTLIPSNSLYFLDLFTKLGFTKICASESGASGKTFSVLGRTF